MTAETDDVKLPERVEALLTSPCFRTSYRGWPVEVAEIEREWMNRLRAEIASALAAEAKAREAAEQELRRIARWVGAEPNESAFDAVARCKTAREVTERERDEMRDALRSVGIFRSDEAGDDGSEWCVTLDPRGEEPVGTLEDALRATLDAAKRDGGTAAEARVRELEAVQERIIHQLDEAVQKLHDTIDLDVIVSHDDHRAFGALNAYQHARQIVAEEADAARQAGEVK